MTQNVRVGLVGYGLSGSTFHAPIIKGAGLELRAVVTSRAETVQAEQSEAEPLARLEDLTARADIDLVVIATPHALHHEQALLSIEAGKHVVIDKPFAVSAENARQVFAAAEKKGVLVTAYHNRRWDADFLTVRRLLADGDLGELMEIELLWQGFRPNLQDRWQDQQGPGAGILWGLGPHMIDQLLLLWGKPDWLQADLAAQRGSGAPDDTFFIRCGFGQRRASVTAGALVTANATRYRLHGLEGSFIKAGFDRQEPQLRAGIGPGHPDFGVEPEKQWGSITRADGRTETVTSAAGSWVSFYQQMAAAIVEGRPVPVAPEDVLEGIDLIEAAIASHEQGRRIDFSSDS